MFNAPLTSSRSTRAKLFLYAEDNEDDRMIVGLTVRNLCKELDVRFVGDGSEAVDWLSGKGVYADRNAHPLPDLLLVDLHMPKMNGFALIRWVRSQAQFAQLPIIVYCDPVAPDSEQLCKELGAHEFVSKGGNRESLDRFLRSYMAAHGLRANERLGEG